MIGRVEMLGRVPVLGLIAAAHVAAGQAESKVDPGVSRLQALLASLGVRSDVSDLV
jgi:hypothetical protein